MRQSDVSQEAQNAQMHIPDHVNGSCECEKGREVYYIFPILSNNEHLRRETDLLSVVLPTLHSSDNLSIAAVKRYAFAHRNGIVVNVLFCVQIA